MSSIFPFAFPLVLETQNPPFLGIFSVSSLYPIINDRQWLPTKILHLVRYPLKIKQIALFVCIYLFLFSLRWSISLRNNKMVEMTWWLQCGHVIIINGSESLSKCGHAILWYLWNCTRCHYPSKICRFQHFRIWCSLIVYIFPYC